MLNVLMRWFVQSVLALRYRVRVGGLDEVAARGTRGILFLPNHPALIDPIIVLSRLARRFAPRPLADRDQVDRFCVRRLARRVGVLPIPDLRAHGHAAREQTSAAVEACAAALRRGDNLLLYPAGHLQRSRLEDLRGNSAVEQILRLAPDARVVLIRTSGLWGSSFSMAGGQVPNVRRILRRGALQLLANFVFFTPRRPVTLELFEPADLPRSAGRGALNAYLENYYNRAPAQAASARDAGPPAATHVPYTIWQRGGTRALPEPTFGVQAGDAAEVPEATRKLVEDHLRKLTGAGQMALTDRLAQDLGLDSLARAELLIWLNTEFGAAAADVDALQTVADVLLATRGEAVGRHVVALKPIPAAWHDDRGAVRCSAPAGATLTEVFLAQARRNPAAVVIADQTSGARSYRDLITAVLALRPQFASLPGEALGILLPASVGALVSYLTALFSGKTPVLVNWTTGARNIDHSLELTGASKVITARALVARLAQQGLDLSALTDRLVFVEDLAARLTGWQKLRAALRARWDWSSLAAAPPTPTAAILLTSGSEALPKAVPLSHTNLLTNIRDVLAVYGLYENDRLMGFLPPFHSFGLTVTMLLPLLAGLKSVYHPNPTETWLLARLIEAYRCTVLVGTPTFLSSLVRTAGGGQLASLRLAITGAERCPERTYDAVAAACPGAVILEGYGVTECAPIVAANREEDARRGTIGRPLPSVEIALVDPETRAEVATGQVGMLLVRGASVFGGYLGDAPSPFVAHRGQQWYQTGDLVCADDSGVLHFRGRLKRFVKIGGEMISLPAIEGVLEPLYAREDDEGASLAVEATGDERQCELVLFTTHDVDRATANRQIREAGLSALHNVARVVRVEAIPQLGTGKTDYRALRALL